MQELIDQIKELSKTKEPFIIAIEGMASSGKTTLAHCLSRELDANVIHMDDFFLPVSMRTSSVGGNMDFKRFQNEILSSISKEIQYHPFDCKSQSFKKLVSLAYKKFLIIEGTYSLFPSLGKYYDFSIFKKVTPEEQKKRLFQRDKEKYSQFLKVWIPLEQAYFSAYEVEKSCNIIIKDMEEHK